jgi:hypothetical protein
MDQSLRPFPRAEAFLDARAESDLPMLDLADRISDMLGMVLEKVELPKVEGVPSDRWQQTRAAMYLGMLAGRSLRAEMALLRLGYDAEAFVFQRRIIEIHARIQRVLEHDHGPQHARDWLQGRERKASSVIEIPKWWWDGLSHVAHADYRAAEQHLLRSRSDGLHDFLLLPVRDPSIANASLVNDAASVRDVAVAVANFVKHKIPGLTKLDGELAAAADTWLTAPEDRASS